MTVRQLVRRLEERREYRHKAELIEAMQRAHTRGHSIDEIADRFAVEPVLVNHYTAKPLQIVGER